MHRPRSKLVTPSRPGDAEAYRHCSQLAQAFQRQGELFAEARYCREDIEAEADALKALAVDKTHPKRGFVLIFMAKRLENAVLTFGAADRQVLGFGLHDEGGKGYVSRQCRQRLDICARGQDLEHVCAGQIHQVRPSSCIFACRTCQVKVETVTFSVA